MNGILDKLKKWQENSVADGINYNDMHKFICFRAEKSFDTFLPASGPEKRFETRLINWLNNLDNVSQQSLLFRLVPDIYFFNEDEFNSLCRAAYNDIIFNWLIDIHSDTLDILNENLQDKLKEEVAHTWFCSVTDSMNIANFCHINKIHGNSHRPNWRDLSWFADMNKVKNYIKMFNIRQIVLLEDFIGSGNQFVKKERESCLSILDCINYIQNEYKFLIAPLIICPKGQDNITSNIEELENVKLKPVVVLSDECFINTDVIIRMQTNDENKRKYYQDLHDLIQVIHKSVSFKGGSFGYEKTGSLVILYTNCPNNTISIIHEDKANKWCSLFPRVDR
jgi:hypothetical protein